MTDQNHASQKLKAAREFAQGKTDTDYLLVHKRESGPEIQSLEFRGPVQNEFEKLVVDTLTRYVDEIRDGSRSVRDLSAMNTVTDETMVQHAEMSDLPETEMIRALSVDRDYPAGKYDDGNPPDLQLIKITDGDKVLMGIQNHQGLKTYDHSEKGISFLYNNEVYTKFEGSLMIVPETLNAVYFDGHVFVMTPKSFEKMFDMREEYENKAEAVINGFEDAGIQFADERIPEEWLMGDIRILRKLYSVHENEIPRHATPENIREIIEKYEVEVQYEMNGDSIELDLERYQDIWKLLKVLNSDYAEAELLPDARLEIDSKRILDD